MCLPSACERALCIIGIKLHPGPCLPPLSARLGATHSRPSDACLTPQKGAAAGACLLPTKLLLYTPAAPNPCAACTRAACKAALPPLRSASWPLTNGLPCAAGATSSSRPEKWAATVDTQPTYHSMIPQYLCGATAVCLLSLSPCRSFMPPRARNPKLSLTAGGCAPHARAPPRTRLFHHVSCCHTAAPACMLPRCCRCCCLLNVSVPACGRNPCCTLFALCK